MSTVMKEVFEDIGRKSFSEKVFMYFMCRLLFLRYVSCSASFKKLRNLS